MPNMQSNGHWVQGRIQDSPSDEHHPSGEGGGASIRFFQIFQKNGMKLRKF